MASLGKRGRVQSAISILDADLYSCKNLIETFLKKSEAQNGTSLYQDRDV